MKLRCPACGRTILSRRNKLCAFCGEPLPEELRFNPAEVEALEAVEKERQQTRMTSLENAGPIEVPARFRGQVATRLQCPACGRTILSRRNKLCGFCGVPLPAELLFTPAEVEAIEAAEKERARLREVRDEERRQAAKRRAADSGGYNGGGDFGGGFGGFG